MPRRVTSHDNSPINGQQADWTPAIDRADGPLYLALANAIATDIASGVLRPGLRLPPQRVLAGRLGIDFTTVTRAYTEARRRGLVEGKVGQGTWVSAGAGSEAAEAPVKGAVIHAPLRPAARSGLIDMSMNLPPPVTGAALSARMWNSIASIGHDAGVDLLMRYQEPGGGRDDREAGAAWLAPRLPELDPARVLACPGAQSAILAACNALCRSGDAICTGSLAYPGIISVAAALGLRLLPVAMDDDGILPEALDAICRTGRPRALYCTPTLGSPTTCTMPLERREALIAVARHHGLAIIEDDAYGALAPDAPPPLAQLAPDMVCYIAGMSKCLAPALRVAWMAAPDMRAATRLAAALRATTLMASPLNVAIAASWIQSGIADETRDAIGRETSARVQLARRILPAPFVTSDTRCFHLWLEAPAPWTGMDLAARLRAAGVAAVPAEAFAIGPAPQALRLGLGVPATRSDLERSLHVTADLLVSTPEFAQTAV